MLETVERLDGNGVDIDIVPEINVTFELLCDSLGMELLVCFAFLLVVETKQPTQEIEAGLGQLFASVSNVDKVSWVSPTLSYHSRL